MKQNKMVIALRKINWLYNPLSTLKNNLIHYKTYRILKQTYDQLKEQDISFLYCEPPSERKIERLSEFERDRIATWIFDFNYIDDNIDLLRKVYGERISKEYLEQVYDGIKVVKWGKGKKLVDYVSRYVNVVNGTRLTSGQPEAYLHTVHLYGACTVRGTGVEDRHTIASFLQEMLNDMQPDTYLVVNHGIGCGSTIEDDFEKISETLFRKGDIAILLHQSDPVFIQTCRKNHIPYFESSGYFEGASIQGEWFTDDTLHTNRCGNKILAEALLENLQNMGMLKHTTNAAGPVRIKASENKIDYAGLRGYMNTLNEYKGGADEYNGAIVMNCNPFTNGHRYLIEESAKKVDRLFIFVVEEDKSFFPFQERMELVRLGVQGIDNVTVIPSGRFIISAETFPGYFYKEENTEAVIDASKDLEIFGKYIAPALNIKVRFAGEEPIDKVTEQYNKAMRETLPQFGITFHEMKRKRSDSSIVISASEVRRQLKQNHFGAIKAMVPATTYDYLARKYKEHKDTDD